MWKGEDDDGEEDGLNMLSNKLKMLCGPHGNPELKFGRWKIRMKSKHCPDRL
jgi:hypothetical protein